MRSAGVAFSAAVALLAAAGALGCHLRAEPLRGEARWLLERASAHGAGYAASFDGRHAELQQATLTQRRAVVGQVHLWQTGQLFLSLVTIVASVATYFIYLLHRLRGSLESVDPG